MIPYISSKDINSTVNFDLLCKEIASAIENKKRCLSIVPLRSLIYQDNPFSAYISMPALAKTEKLYISKVATFIKHGTSLNLPSIQSVVIAFCSESGRPLALLDGNIITNLKCAALSNFATNKCAVSNASVLALIGSGVQARQQVLSNLHCRKINKIKIFSRTHENAEKLRYEIYQSYNNVEVSVCIDLESAIKEADIIATTTTSITPLGAFNDLKPSVHINCMGAHTPESRELPNYILRESMLVVEDLETAVKEAGPSHKDAIDLERLSQLSTDTNLAHNRTVFASTGHAYFDLQVVAYILRSLKLI